jgi:hypothetical protein
MEQVRNVLFEVVGMGPYRCKLFLMCTPLHCYKPLYWKVILGPPTPAYFNSPVFKSISILINEKQTTTNTFQKLQMILNLKS